MSTQYLLPCPCGKKIPVETTQAGQTVRCECGQEHEVPTLLKLRDLETVADAECVPPAASWGLWHGVTFAGAMVVCLAVAAGVYFYANRPVAPMDIFTEAIIERDFQKMNVFQSEQLWSVLSQGLGNSRPAGEQYRQVLRTYYIPRRATISEAYAGAKKQYSVRLTTTLIIFLLGAGTTIWGIVGLKTRSRRDEVDYEDALSA